MAVSRTELLTQHFYEWEKRGRGWYVFDAPIELEPEFVPFFPYTGNAIIPDDTLRPSFLGGIGDMVKKTFAPSTQLSETEAEPTSEDVRAYYLQTDEPLQVFSLSFPEGENITPLQVEKFLTMLSYCKHLVSFEILATSSVIRVQFVCRQSDGMHLEGQVKAYFPACIVAHQTELGIYLSDKHMIAVVDFALKEEYMRPLLQPQKFDIDPLTGLYGVLEHLQEDEAALIQILFKGTVNPWASSIIDSVSDGKGDSFFIDAPEMPKLALEKVSAPLFAVSIRAIGQAATEERAMNVLSRIANAVVHSSASTTNSLLTIGSVAYPFTAQLSDAVARQTRRIGMVLSAKELATFTHYPTGIGSKKLERNTRKTKPAPRIAEGHDFALGQNIHQGVVRLPTLNQTQRLKHMHVIGATGTGKSTFLQMCVAQDIYLGNGVAVLDPHGDLIEGILPYISNERYKDVIIVDPSDSDFPVGFNILSAHSDIEKEILASDLVAVFRRLSTSFGDQMHSVLANAILAFVESSEGGTLIDLRRFLIEKPYRDLFLKTVSDPSVVYYWQKEYPLLKSSSIGPILTRLDMFLRPKAIRNMVAQKKSLDFEDILDSQKILFIKLSQGLIGTENSYLLGSFIVSKIYQAAMARQAQSKSDRKPFYLYIDEFQNFITPSMSSILSGTRKYGLGCVLAHQDMIQLQRQDTELASAVISNAGTRVCFRLGDIDAKRFEDGFSSFEATDLQNLGTGQAIVRIERPVYDFNLSTVELKDIDEETKQNTINTIITLSREKYGTPREEVEQSLEYLRSEQHVEEKHVVEEPSIVTPKTEEKPTPKIPKQEQVKAEEIQDTTTKEHFVKRKEVTEHRYTQTLIKKMSEARGYKATIEEVTSDGKGRIDVSLERNGKRIACEIGVTTTKDWEVHNIEKCLAAGYDRVVAIAKDSKSIRAMQLKISQTISRPMQEKILVLDTEGLFMYLDKEISKEATTEKRVKGYRVKVEYEAVSEEEMQIKRDGIAEVILKNKMK